MYYYRPPHSMDALYHTLQSLNPSLLNSFALVGDFDINVLYPSDPLLNQLSVILNSVCLSQVVNSPTHVAHNGHVSLIDLALLSDPASLHSCHVLPPISNSDHYVVSCHFIHRSAPHSRCDKRTVWRYSKAS